jgi:hypothetical protein
MLAAPIMDHPLFSVYSIGAGHSYIIFEEDWERGGKAS